MISGTTPMADPQRVGRYQIKRVLGHGGMGTVYLAEDPLLKRRVAIKVVRASGEAREHAMIRFKREAEISAQLNHPNVITIFDVGIEPEIGPFLTMEFVEGKSLAQHIKDKSLDMEAAIRVLIQAAKALRAAHRMAVVHRDVKPENILLGEEGRAKLMDFGIARSFTHSPSPMDRPFASHGDLDLTYSEEIGTIALRITSTGDFLGSPAYAPPEVLRGADGTPSSDRYSFAVTAFELLTGRLPHPGDTLAAIIGHILQQPPMIPLDMDPRVGRVFSRAMASDPDERHPTLMDFLEELLDTLPLNLATKTRLYTYLNQSDDGSEGSSGPRRTLPQSALPSQPTRLMPEVQPRPKKISLDTVNQPLSKPSSQRMPIQPRHQTEAIAWGAWIKGALLLVGTLYGVQWLWPRLNPSPRTLNVSTSPSKARVFVDGVYLGETPIRGAKIPGRARDMMIQRTGYTDQLKRLLPGDQDLSFVLEKPGQGITVESEPAGAAVAINGVPVGQTPFVLPTVERGTEIVVSMEGFRPYVGRVDVGLPRPIVLEKIMKN